MRHLALALLFASAAAAEDMITTESLLKEMVDLERLATPADYACRQFSSFDRASEKGDPFANADSGNYIRREKGEFVLAEAMGPGAIVRIWSANPDGKLKIYLDGSLKVEADFEDLLSGKVEPFREPLAAERAKGFNLYFPFPYSRTMKVVCTKGNQYYHVGIRTWPIGTKVRTYDRKEMPEDRVAIVRGQLIEPNPKIEGKRVEWGAEPLAGPGTITEFAVDASGARPRECLLKITIDGELRVCAPLVDFFGTAPDPVSLRTLPFVVSPEGAMICRFPMPFEKSAALEISGGKVRAWATVRPGPPAPLRFHAWWRGSRDVRTRPFSDWPVLNAVGRGRFVGTTLSVRNPVKAWWGEGDEKISVDGESFPSTFGTGTEDYFGYAWCHNGLFTAPYHSQSRCDGPGNRGFTAVNRFLILDDIPFQKSLLFNLEIWHQSDTTLAYSTVAYWYAEPGGTHDFQPPRAEDMKVEPLPPPNGVVGAIEGERMEVISCSGGETEDQEMVGFGAGWSRDGQLWWKGGRVGDVLVLGFESEVEGKKRVKVVLTKAPDYGKVELKVNGEVAAAWDGYGEVVGAVEMEVEAVLRKGRNEFRVEVVGTNEKAAPRNHMFGLDYIKIEP